MKINLIKTLSFIIALSTLFACKDDGEFENNAFLVSPKSVTIINKLTVTNVEKTVTVGLAKPEDKTINLNINVNTSLLTDYNQIFNLKAEILPTKNYALDTTQAKINVGDIKSNDFKVNLLNLNELDREQIYVLPLQINSSQIDVLKSSSIVYFTIKGGALIDNVANMNENFLTSTGFKTASALNNLTDFTIEALIYPRELNKLISSIVGIEGTFLLRLGDAGVPPNKLQIANSTSGNRTIDKEIPLNKWTHLSITYSKAKNNLKVYYDGIQVFNDENYRLTSLNLGVNGFHIGKSWDDNRSFNGEFSEVRIWNIAREVEDIKTSFYEVPNDSKGLVAYWKINEGNGNLVKDYTSNGNDLTSNKAIKWVSVELPEKK